MTGGYITGLERTLRARKRQTRSSPGGQSWVKQCLVGLARPSASSWSKPERAHMAS
jgi:hypothetical protein